MNDHDRLLRDTATIVRIVKFLLILGLIAGALYYGLRILVLLLPFVIGFILAETSITLANQLHRLTGRWSGKSGETLTTGPDTGAAGVSNSAEPAAGTSATGAGAGRPRRLRWRPIIGQWPESTRPSIMIYLLIVVLFFALAIGIIIIAISQLRSLATYLTAFFSQSNLAEQLASSLHTFLKQASGGLMTEETILAVQAQLVTIMRDLVQRIPAIVTTIVNALGGFVADLPIIFFSLIVVLMSGYYFISDSKSVTTFLSRNLPNTGFREKTGRLISTLANKLFRVIGGYLLLFLFTFTVALIGLLLIEMPYALVFALVAAFVDFLPVLGIGATITPIAIYMFVNGNLWGGVGAIATGLFITLARRIIEPPILGGAMQLHPLATLFAMIVGVGLYGLLGLLIGPVILVIGNEILSLYGFDIKLRAMLGDMLTRFSDG